MRIYKLCSATLLGLMLCAASAQAQDTAETATDEMVLVEEVTFVAEPGCDGNGGCDQAIHTQCQHPCKESISEAIGAEPVNESELSRKMIQAEKARNAAENDSWGGAITIIAMCIVIGALIILSLLFLLFGKISASLMNRRKLEAHGVDETTVEDHHNELDSGEAIAAIAMALAEHFGQGHDLEDTVLTIKRMKRVYSPWNSKIYNMRHMPELNKQSNSRR